MPEITPSPSSALLVPGARQGLHHRMGSSHHQAGPPGMLSAGRGLRRQLTPLQADSLRLGGHQAGRVPAKVCGVPGLRTPGLIPLVLPTVTGSCEWLLEMPVSHWASLGTSRPSTLPLAPWPVARGVGPDFTHREPGCRGGHVGASWLPQAASQPQPWAGPELCQPGDLSCLALSSQG